ncbi:putrescine importer [Gammaproteobacteria bacterium]|nr:putrescine importer [Gammaproteobacteria bacterium]
MQKETVRMKRVLGVPALVFFGLAYMVPLGIFTTYGEVTFLSEGHLPVAYILTLLTMIFTAYSYCQMTRELPLSGSAYSYVQKTFGGNLGFLVGWAQLLDYLFLPILNYLVIGIYLHEAFPMIPISIFILSSIAIVTILNILGIKLVNSMNMLIVILQFVFIVIFLCLCIYGQNDWSIDTLLQPLVVASGQMSGLLSGAAILCLAFLGFDAISTLAEETKNPKRSLPRAIMITVLVAGGLFIIIAYLAHLSYPNWQQFTGNNIDTAGLIIFKKVGGTLFVSLFIAVYITGVFASAMTSQASIVRIFFAMGREGVLPKSIFSYLHPQYRTPVLSIIFVSIASLSALFISLSMVVSMISFGALTAFTFVNLSVIKYFIINQKQRSRAALLRYLVMPTIGVILTLWLWSSLHQSALLIGLSWLLIGLAYLLVLTRGFSLKPPAISDAEMSSIIN